MTAPAEEASLREVMGRPDRLAIDKVLQRLDRHCRRFIELSPFLCLGTSDADGRADVSPRGDPPGFVKVLDDRTLLIPERPGNRRVDSMSNLLANPSVGLIFFVPGIDETLRLNGRASLVDAPEPLAELAVNGKVPKLAIRVDVDEVFFHCAKALRRSRLWDPETRVDAGAFPSLGRIVRDQIDDVSGRTVEELDAEIEESYRTTLY